MAGCLNYACEMVLTCEYFYAIVTSLRVFDQVRSNYLEIIDNIQQADPEEVLMSQTVTRSSQRYMYEE